MATSSALIGELSTTHKLDNTIYEMWCWKIQYFLNDKELLEHFMVTKVPSSDKDRDSKPIDTTEHY